METPRTSPPLMLMSICFMIHLKPNVIYGACNKTTEVMMKLNGKGKQEVNCFSFFLLLLIQRTANVYIVLESLISNNEFFLSPPSNVIYRFSTKEAATHAIVAVHNSEINAQTVKCSWGKESGDPNNAPSITSQALSQAGFPFGTAYGQQVAGYWYPPAPTYPTTPAPAAAPIQGQFLQGMQGYAYGQFAGYQQGYMG